MPANMKANNQEFADYLMTKVSDPRQKETVNNYIDEMVEKGQMSEKDAEGLRRRIMLTHTRQVLHEGLKE